MQFIITFINGEFKFIYLEDIIDFWEVWDFHVMAQAIFNINAVNQGHRFLGRRQ